MNEAHSAPVELRRLWPPDKEAFRDHLLNLDPNGRHSRFGGGVSDDFLIRYAENCFGEGDLVYGAFAGGELIGAGELRSNRAIWREPAPFGRDIHAEAAFSVDPHHRRRGVGETLFKRILRAAANHGVETIEIVCLPDNTGMQNLARKFHAEFAFEQNALTGRLTARPPTAFSRLREASSDALDFGAALFDAHWRALAGGREKGA
ncbi:MAG TPA: GNAT family N-acetyltransferase [Roseiarcus sp.]|nr:GNAT family N-acetyltransferase [Roseiarcus sp.]